MPRARTIKQSPNPDLPYQTTASRDADGNPIEAATEADEAFISESGICSVTTQPIAEIGKLYRKGGVQQTGPNGSVVWYASGPVGVSVTERLERVANSGGHSHGGATSDPSVVGVSTPATYSFTTPYPQNIRIVHRVTMICGSIRSISQFSDGEVITCQTDVLVTNLIPITPSINLELKTPTSHHPSPYWGTRDFVTKLTKLANDFAAKTGKSIVITDASLQFGGRFDLDQNWRPPHHEHADGRQADIRSRDMSAQERTIFQQCATAARLTVLRESDHWHVRG